MKNLGGKAILILIVCAGLVFLIYRFSSLQQEAAALHKDAMESAVTPVAITHIKRSEATDTVTLPGTIEGWFEARSMRVSKVT